MYLSPQKIRYALEKAKEQIQLSESYELSKYSSSSIIKFPIKLAGNRSGSYISINLRNNNIDKIEIVKYVSSGADL